MTRERNDLTHDAAEQAQVLNAYFARARSIILLTAHSSEFRQFYAEAGDRDQRVRRGGPTLDAVNDSLGYLEQLYPDRIGEACFIDASGAENARTVRGERAAYADLSPDEDKQPFFAPSFALGPNQVYQAKPYVSPDTDEWVIANSTLVPMPDGSKPAIVHFEVTIDSFRREAIARSDRTVLVVDADTGQVVINSVRPQLIGAPLGDPADTRFRGLVGGWATTGRLQLDGHQAAYQRIAATPGNANHWYVVSIANNATGTLHRRRRAAVRAGPRHTAAHRLPADRTAPRPEDPGQRREHRRADRPVQPAAPGRRPRHRTRPAPPTPTRCC